jgi:glutaredoxin
MTSRATRCGGWLLLLLAASASAQYKVVDPDGRVTYTDRPPAGAVARALAAPQAPTPAAELPYTLRQAVARYPATFYAAPGCAPCDSARALLRQRGIPVQEFSIDRAEDVAELQRREGRLELPVLRLGSQRLQGFEAGDWQATLDAAGYPRSSQLPPTWRATPVRPLVPVDAEVAAPRQAEASARRPAVPAPVPVVPAAAGSFRF